MKIKKHTGTTKTHDFRFQLKAVSEDGSFEGYGAVFNNVDYGGDIIEPGAFAGTIKDIEASGRKLVMLWQHDTREPIGVFEEISEDEKGLYVKGRLFLTIQRGREAYELLKGGAVSGLSIGYGVSKYERDEETGVRTLKELDLYEVSLVTFPMNDSARIDAVKERIAEGKLPESVKDFEKFLRDAGFSITHAKTIAGHGIRGLLRDVVDEKQGENVLAILQGFSLKQTT